jgi:hypothetical protein
MDCKKYEGMIWIYLAQSRDSWLVVGNTQWTLRFHKMRGIFSVVGELLSSEKEACCLELVLSDVCDKVVYGGTWSASECSIYFILKYILSNKFSNYHILISSFPSYCHQQQ